jgi:hypothetical protein
MVFVKRDSNNQVISVCLEKTPEHQESMPLDSPELAVFTSLLANGQKELATTDLELVRVLEDLVDLLIERDVIRFTDFPEAAQKKFLARRCLRSSLPRLKLLGEDEENGLL